MELKIRIKVKNESDRFIWEKCISRRCAVVELTRGLALVAAFHEINFQCG
jgi:hypothetical protein